MSDTNGAGNATPANNGWQGLRVGQVESAPMPTPPRPTALTPPPLPLPGAPYTPARAPIPVQPIAYAQPDTGRPEPRVVRPASLTRLGAVAIVLGAIGLLINGAATSVWGRHYLNESRAAAVRAGRVPAAAAAATPATFIPTPSDLVPYAGDCIASDGLPRPARQRVIAAVRGKGAALSADRAAMLDRLLADAGDLAFPDAATTPAAEIRSIELDTTPIASNNPALPPAYRITTAHGVIRLDDVSVAFTPDAPNVDPVRVIRNAVSVAQHPPRFCAVAIGDALEATRAAAGGNLNAVQAAVLRDALRLAAVSRRADGRVEAVPLSDVIPGRTPGTLALTVADRSIWLFADGRTVDRRTSPREPDPTSGEPVDAASPAAAAGPSTSAATAALLGLVDSLLGLGVAVLLLIAGISVMTDSPRAPARLARYAVVKITLFITAWVVLYVVLGTPTGLRGGRGGSAAFEIGYQVGYVLGLAAQLAFPAIVLAVLASRTVRDYAAERGWEFGVADPAAWGRLRASFDSAAGRRALVAGALGAFALAALHGWCAAAAAAAESSTHGGPHIAAVVAALVVAAGCLVRRASRTTRTAGAVITLIFAMTPTARGQANAPAAQPPTTRPKIVIELGPAARPGPAAANRGNAVIVSKPAAVPQPATAAPAPATAAPAALAPATPGSAEWFAALRAAPISERVSRLHNLRDLDRFVIPDAARPAAVAAAPDVAAVLFSNYTAGYAAAMSLLEKIGPCEPVQLACVRVMATPALERFRPRAVTLALACDPTGRSPAAQLRPFVVSRQMLANVQFTAARSMAGLGDAGLAVLDELSRSPDFATRDLAVRAVTEGAPTANAVAFLTRQLDDSFVPIRPRAAQALATLGSPGRDVLLTRMFDRPECLAALRQTAAASRPWLADLDQLTVPLHHDEAARNTVLGVIRAMDGGAAGAGNEKLLALLDSELTAVREWAGRVAQNPEFLRTVGPATQQRINAATPSALHRTPVAASATPAAAALWAPAPGAATSAAATTGATAHAVATEPPSTLIWLATGGFALVMLLWLRTLAGVAAEAADPADDAATAHTPRAGPHNLAA